MCCWGYVCGFWSHFPNVFPLIFSVRASRFLPDGSVFDASNAPGRKPIAFKLGARQVIKGWEEVLRLMNVSNAHLIKSPVLVATFFFFLFTFFLYQKMLTQPKLARPRKKVDRCINHRSLHVPTHGWFSIPRVSPAVGENFAILLCL